MLGLASRIQEIVMMTPGIMMRPNVIIPISGASGVFVRVTAQARKVPSANEQRVDMSAK